MSSKYTQSTPLHMADYEDIKLNDQPNTSSIQYTYPTFKYPEPKLEYDTDCAICIENADPHQSNINRDVAYLACGHIYHYDCLMTWQQTIRNYYFNSIECCICKQKVSLTGIWRSDHTYSPINTLGYVTSIRDPLLRGQNIITRPSPSNIPNNRTDTNNINNNTNPNASNNNRTPSIRRRLVAYIPGLSCCFK